MKYLFLHQNFPGQFKVIAERLAAQKGNEVLALRQNRHEIDVKGVAVASYRFLRTQKTDQHPLLTELEAKMLRAEAVAEAARRLKKKGWSPDVIVAHPGWGEALLIKDVWPRARLVSFVEYFYAPEGQDFNFDPEFATEDADVLARLRFKNTVTLHALHESDAIWTATEWQRSTFPVWSRDRIEVIHEGVDMEYFKPDPEAVLTVGGKGVRLTQDDEVITYASRSLEPVRGFHMFMRALPEILRRRPKAHVVLMGKEAASYGQEPRDAKSWLDKMMKEVGPQLDPSRVHLVGFLPRESYRAMLQLSDAHVYLTYPFVLSWSVVEALSCGARLVGSNVGPVREVMPAGNEPYMFDFFDQQGLVDSVSRALTRKKAERTAESRAARALVKKGYSTELQVKALMRLFKG
jgi:glycosyltransferase involved in cell wall biosynthesis